MRYFISKPIQCAPDKLRPVDITYNCILRKSCRALKIPSALACPCADADDFHHPNTKNPLFGKLSCAKKTLATIASVFFSSQERFFCLRTVKKNVSISTRSCHICRNSSGCCNFYGGSNYIHILCQWNSDLMYIYLKNLVESIHRTLQNVNRRGGGDPTRF